MPRLDFTSHRLYVDASLTEDARVELTREQANYLVNVLRLGEGAGLLVFNGRDGEWRATLGVAKKSAALRVETFSRAQDDLPDVDYLFAPLKHARLDYMAQKAVEMGARRLRPVLTRRTQAGRNQSGADARQCRRGGRAMRHDRPCRSRRRGEARKRCWRPGRRTGC